MHRRALLEGAFEAAIAACTRPEAIVQSLPPRPTGRVIVLAAGKGAFLMARAVEMHWPDVSGLVVTREGYGGRLSKIDLIEARHPVPDERGAHAAEQFLALATEAGEADLVLLLLSGGASALLSASPASLTLEAKQALTSALLRSGATIGEINCVRRHLSRIKGGRLAAAAFPATIVTLAVSDVVGDPPSDIGSGPGVADISTISDAQAVLARYGIADPGGWSESIKPGDPRLAHSSFRIVVRPAEALGAAGRYLEDSGYETILLDADATGEARIVARSHTAVALRHLEAGRRVALISGGELTVRLKGEGHGGPNQEYALAFAAGIAGIGGLTALAADTDGVDGNRDVAGAIVDGDTISSLRDLGIEAEDALDRNDAGGALGEIGCLFAPGPTGTNVNDLRIILVDT